MVVKPIERILKDNMIFNMIFKENGKCVYIELEIII